MNCSLNKLLVAIALALLAFIVVTETRQSTAPPPSPTAAPLVPRLRPATVTRVELTRTNLAVNAEFNAGRWHLTHPVAYPANSLLLKTLLDVCAQLRPQLVVPAGQVKSPADFGLDPPQATLRFHQGEAPVELRIGARTPVNDQLYVQVIGAPHVAVTDANLLKFLPQTADDWRDRQLFSLAGVKFDRLRVRTGPRDVLFQRKVTNQLWRIAQPAPEKRGNTPLIEQLLVDLQQWPVQRFVTDDPKADLDPFGLQTPEAELVFSSGTNDTLIVQFGRSPTNQPELVYARNLATTNIMLVAAEPLAYMRAPVWNYSEHRLLDAFAPDAFNTIEVRGREPFTLRRQTNSATNIVWVADDSLRTPIDAQLMQSFLLNLETLAARELEKEIVTDYAAYGLATPARSLTLLSRVTNAAEAPTNRLVARLDFGAVTNLPPDRLYARRHDEGSVYVVARGDVDPGLPWALWQMQDRTVWSFATNQVAAVTVEFDGRTRRIARAGDGRWSEAGQPVDDVRNSALEETLFRLGRLRAERWVHLGADRLPLYGISETRHRVSIELGGNPARTNVVMLGFIPQGRHPWAAVTDPRTRQPLIFEFPRPLFMDYIIPYLSPSM